ncbi:hypothetical protein [Abditibacterium utsteinense]|nr:hypothetical protein [Abditibacterium utsteinense]
MAFYQGGTQANHHSRGYSFLINFFSDLGRTRAYSGAPNLISAPLFAFALSLAGLGLAAFFVAFAGIFWTNLIARTAATFGAALGIFAGASFIGVALTPADINSPLHGFLVFSAFRAFLFAVVPFSILIWSQNRYPKSGAFVFLAFALFLAAYLCLISFGPSPRSPGGLMIQVTGQKLIVYASVVCVGLQSILARHFLRGEFSKP